MPENFRSLTIWQRAFNLTLVIYRITKLFPKEELFGLTNQIRRSSSSVAANIAEAAGRWQNNDRAHLLIIARGSLTETQSHLSVAEGLEYISKKEYTNLDIEYENLAKSINAFIKTLRSKD
jgi:four helix bundle protein